MAPSIIDEDRPIVTRADARAAGASKYFSGKPCPHGHIANRYTINSTCVICFAERDRELKSRKADKERERKRIWKEANRETVRSKERARYAADREKAAKRKREWGAANPDIRRERLKRWRAENPDAARSQVRNRRARLADAEGSHTGDDIRAIREAQRDKCAICGVPLRGKGHVDHIKPLSRGGSNWPRNLQMLCRSCNSSKSGRDPIEFMRLTGRLC